MFMWPKNKRRILLFMEIFNKIPNIFQTINVRGWPIPFLNTISSLVSPLLSFTLESAPCSRRIRAILSSTFWLHATCNGVLPSFFLIFTSAPFFSNSCTIFSCPEQKQWSKNEDNVMNNIQKRKGVFPQLPYWTAKCSAVLPSFRLRFTLTPFSKNIATTSSRPCTIDAWKGVFPSLSFRR